MAKPGMTAHEVDINLTSTLDLHGSETERMTNGHRFRSVVSVLPHIAQFSPPSLTRP